MIRGCVRGMCPRLAECEAAGACIGVPVPQQLQGPRMFPVLHAYVERRKRPDCPTEIPWSWLAPHEAQAMTNHGGQSLDVLASRGGMDALEIVCVLRDKPWPTSIPPSDLEHVWDSAVDELIARAKEAA